MKLDHKLYLHTVAIFLFALFLPYIGHNILTSSQEIVEFIELFQSLWLLFGALFTWFYIKTLQDDRDKQIFWLWSVIWWLLLFGRGINWGRNYLPDVPKSYFRLVSVVLIGITVLMLILPAVRREIIRRFRTEAFPVWDGVLMVVYFLISDTIEHHRLLSFLFVYDVRYRNLMEELYELPFMFSLFFIVFYLQQKERQVSALYYSRSSCKHSYPQRRI
ncbi:hypothetical protein BIY29_00730 [Brenneria alni]|uniref:Nitric oxide reductase n=1 Tax=Brenneria alni TaxID=71656 RepID=A0A421DU54_9GAMM|nr:hypothetical protein [Brenneria alni]RLM28286.1 hypothetical protein BIY29_00730 [Brenneria alni]